MGLRKSISEKHNGKVVETGRGAGADHHAVFHRFAEIGHIFHNKYTFNNKTHFSSWNLAKILSEWLGNPGKGTLKTKNPKKFPEGARLLILLEACAFGACLGSRWEFILRRQEIHKSEENGSR